MTRRTAAVFCMPEQGHFKRLLGLIGGLARAGVTPHVFTDLRYRSAVERAGGRFADLFAGRPLDAADAKSRPVPCRYVSFAAHHAESLLRELAPLGPDLIVHDTFAVIGVVAANALGLPRVAVCSGHNAPPEPTVAALRRDPRVQIADECWRAVALLRERYGMPDASPFSYAAQRLRVYASFGTVVWRYFEADVLAALTAVSDAVAELDDAVALVGLGGRGTPEHAAGLTRRNVRVEGYVAQWRALNEASVFITHHGLNSTHEAIFQRTPMLSYPFFGGQPALARRCQELGLALPLADAPRAAVTAEAIRAALARCVRERESMLSRLEAARSWELTALRGRSAVIERILGLPTRAAK